MFSDIWKWWLFVISNESVSDSMHLTSFINLLSVQPRKIAILISGHDIYKSKQTICKKKINHDVDLFCKKQPNCKLDSYERATNKENLTISSWDWGRHRSEEIMQRSDNRNQLLAPLSLSNKLRHPWSYTWYA